MKSSLFNIIMIACCLLSFCSCNHYLTFEDNHITVYRSSAKYVMFGYYIGENTNFVIDADYVINRHPECILTIPNIGEGINYASIYLGAIHDGKENERTYQFIFFDGETLDKYTLSEIAERNLYDDLQILTFDQLRAANLKVTYNGPKVQ